MSRNIFVILILLYLVFACSADVCVANTGVWLTKSDGSALLEKQSAKLRFEKNTSGLPQVEINDDQVFQTIDGFGYALTGGSAEVINGLEPKTKKKLLRELFGNGKRSIGISYLRISIGASDLNSAPFTYSDLPQGETDLNLEKFSLAADEKDVIPLLKEIIRINPRVKIMGSPWSAPLWMKDNNSFWGGRLQLKYYNVYARYFVKYIREMAARGIRIEAITPQNEPLHPGNNPSMLMSAAEQIDFVKNHLGPEFRKAKMNTKIIIYDHNCDKPEYAIEVLNDPGAKQYIDGSAFHLYAGDISAMSKVRDAHPDKNLYFTEQYTSSKGEFGGDLNWHLKNVIIGATRNWSKVVLEWNLANDAEFKPHTPGGCNVCKGALTISKNSVTRNVSYYIIAHASKFVPPGSVRIGSNFVGSIRNVAFKTPDGKKVLIALNDSKEATSFGIRYKQRIAIALLPAGGVGTYVWK